jgi:hypothetical protein
LRGDAVLEWYLAWSEAENSKHLNDCMWDGTGEAQGIARASKAMVGKIEDVGKRQDGINQPSRDPSITPLIERSLNDFGDFSFSHPQLALPPATLSLNLEAQPARVPP